MEILIIALGFIVLILFFKGVRVVPQAQNWIVERFGKFNTILKPGLNLINPIFSKVAKKVDIRETFFDLPKQPIIFADNASADVDGIVFYTVMDPYKSYYGIQELEMSISNLALTHIRSIMGKMTLDESLSSRDKINAELLTNLDQATDAWGTKIMRVEIKDITPPRDIQDSMARQMKAEREKRARVLEAEAQRISQATEAEGFKEARILEAEARKESSIRDAEARERLSQAEATSIKMIAEALKSTGGDPLVYMLGQQYFKGLMELGGSQNSKFLVLPADIMSTIQNLFKKV